MSNEEQWDNVPNFVQDPLTPIPGPKYALQSALDAEAITREQVDATLVPLAEVGVPGGVASLDETGKVPLSELPGGSGGDGVDSFNGRTGVVTAQSGDYSANQVSADPAGSASTAQTNAESFATAAVLVEQERAESVEELLIPISQKGIDNGVATLDGTGKVPLSQLPAGSGVSTFNGRSGVVVPQSGDYTAGQVGADASGAASTAQSNAQSFATSAVAVETSRAEAAEGLLIPLAQKGAGSGVATLDTSSQVPLSELGNLPTSYPPNGSAGGDLSGTYPNPGVAKVNGVTISNSPTTGEALVATSTTAASWQTVGSSAVSSVSNSDGTLTASPTTGAVVVSRPAITGDVSIPSTSNVSTVNKINGVTVTGTPASGNVITASTSTAASWQAPAAGGVSSVTAGDASVTASPTTGAVVVESGTLDQVANLHPPVANWSNNSHKITSVANGSSAQDVAAFGQIPTSLPPNGSASGDLSGTYPGPTLAAIGSTTGPIGSTTTSPSVTIDTKGRVTSLTSNTISGTVPGGSAGGDLSSTYPNPTVSKVNGVSVTGTPLSGYTITATSGTAATWQAQGSAPVSSVSAGDASVVISPTTGAVVVESGTLDQVATLHPPATSWSNNSQKITGGATPTSATDFAIKSYVDGVAQGLDVKQSVKVTTATNQTGLTGLPAIDGYTLLNSDRLLLTGQTTSSQNGIWQTAVAGSGAWTRPLDFATGSIQNGVFVFVDGGTIGAGSGWVMTGTGNVIVDTTAQTWTQFSGAGEITVDSSLTKSGNQLGRAALTGDITASAGSNATTLKTTGPGTSTVGSSTAVPIITPDAQGRLSTLSTAATVGTVTATDSSIVMGGTATAPTVQRAALTGDVSASAGSNTVTVSKVNGTSVPASPSTNNALVATSGTTATWQAIPNSVAAADGSVTVTPTTGAVTVSRAALTGDITASAGSNATTLKNTGPGVTGPLGSATVSPIVTIDAQGRVTALSSVTISGVAPGGSASGDLSGTYPGPTVAKVQGISITSAEATLLSQSNGAQTRSTTATVVAGETTIFTGSTSAQTLTLPVTPQTSTTNTVVNTASVSITVVAGAGNTINNMGTVGSLTLATLTMVDLVIVGTVWYVREVGTTVAAETARALAAEALLLPLTGGTMSGAIAMGSNKITGLTNGTASSDAAAFGQIPTSLPPNGSAGGDLTGTYPSPTLAAIGSATGPIGSASTSPSITIDAKGRVTALTSNTISGTAPGGTAGGNLSGTYPNPTVASINGTTVPATPSTNNALVATSGTAATWQAIVNTFNTRTGAVSPASGDYTAAQVTNAADKSTATTQTFTASLSTPGVFANLYDCLGNTGAGTTTIWIGGTSSAAPTIASPVAGWWAVDAGRGTLWVYDGTVWDDVSLLPTPINVNGAPAANYTLALSDGNSELVSSSATGITVTIPPNSSVAFKIGTIINVTQGAAGQITMTAGAGVTMNSAGSLVHTRVTWSAVSILKTAINTWDLVGDLA